MVDGEHPSVQRFPDPFDVQAPPDATGWERMYPYYLLFSNENRAWEQSRLWFQDGMHHPEVEYPFDTIVLECWRLGLGQYNSRIFAVPTAYGIEQRIVNGYVYVTPVPVTDDAWVGERAQIFAERAGYYYRNWDDIFSRWKVKMEDLIRELKGLAVPTLPRLEGLEAVTSARGTSRGFELLQVYERVVKSIFLAWQYHFEMLNLGYAAYLNLFVFCREAFPGIKDETIAQMVAGADMLFFRPDDELKKLARLALDLGLADQIRGSGSPVGVVDALRHDQRGRAWVEAFESVQDPWFYFSNGAGF